MEYYPVVSALVAVALMGHLALHVLRITTTYVAVRAVSFFTRPPA